MRTRPNKNKDKYEALYTKQEICKMKNSNYWVNHLIAQYHYNPLLCYCGATMTFCYELSYFPGGIKDG